MGCGCKGDLQANHLKKEENGELNFTGRLLRIPTGILLTLIYVIISPFLLVYIWWLAMKYVFGYKPILFAFLKRFQKKRYERPDFDNEDEEFNEDDYELLDVDIIK